VRTELTKLSWRNPLFWLAVPLSILIPVGINYGLVKAHQAGMTDGSGGMDTDNSGYWIMLFAPFIMMAVAVSSFCSEFNNRTIELSTAIEPRRWIVPVAKLTVYGAVTALTVMTSALILLVGFPRFFPDVWGRVDLQSEQGLRIWIGIPIYAVLVLAMGLGLAVLIPRASLVIAAIVLWKYGVEMMAFPRLSTSELGARIQQYGPFANAEYGAGQFAAFEPPFGSNVALTYFGVFAVVIFTIGLARLTLRDLKSD